jgi:branched-chain amino acid transport system substrate-binding protein
VPIASERISAGSWLATGFALISLFVRAPELAAQELRLPILVPLAGPLSPEARSQRNGALLAASEPTPGEVVEVEIHDAGLTPEAASLAFERLLARPGTIGVFGPALEGKSFALLPIAARAEVPVITISGAEVSGEPGSPWHFQFYPSAAELKTTVARFAVEERGAKRPAILQHLGDVPGPTLSQHLARHGTAGVASLSVPRIGQNLVPTLARIKAASPDSLLLYLNRATAAQAIRQARSIGFDVPILAGPSLAAPSTADLLDPGELKGVCAAAASAPISETGPAIESFVRRYRAQFGESADSLALAQYDALRIVLGAVAGGARTPSALRDALHKGEHRGLAMTYRSDGKGNMAHQTVVVCYDGIDRTPRLAKRYSPPSR